MGQRSSAPPSPRTRVRRIAELADYEQATLHAILDEAYVCHIAFHDGESSHCIPTACWRIDNHLYIHGSNGSRMVKALLGGAQASVAVTHIDGLVLAKSAFSHSMNYRSAVIYGVFEQIRGNAKKMEAMDVFMDKLAPGRRHEARTGNAKELAATNVLRISLDEAAAKVSNNGPSDKDEDLDLPVWAGVLPLVTMHGSPIGTGNDGVATPDYVTRWANDNN
ncbi:pyridoxamine 5'-phosphate oxidase family protein [Massilia antarctica]|uniref:pyridoxamine 5'-phosphate oxidase family protein n=1 Tax=Massilia antarctica TaxID=2765360 RepID=UPI0006BB9829|nr:pyridoxamine 5'-phosphate oxidase family protein [Massilia sp. H27-R4]MCY0915970.1 pyridoxamine 5'-phosphate oxidase family protein [Massilia sp. H27-R4]CUI07241.1 Pyridoxamine 5'-phosphate oxidase [Janthinobacterium sp. CG23_2]CUU31027.1 Pyridoxamine 5'-phosphate oxidase [Janthinobacterium sp. CG23_2]